MFSKNIRTLYLYVVSFLSLMAMIYGILNLTEKITNYIYPVDYAYSQTYDTLSIEKDSYTTVNTAEDIATQKQNIQIRTLREIFTSLAVILIAAPLYSYHWIMVQKERKDEQV